MSRQSAPSKNAKFLTPADPKKTFTTTEQVGKGIFPAAPPNLVPIPIETASKENLDVRYLSTTSNYATTGNSCMDGETTVVNFPPMKPFPKVHSIEHDTRGGGGSAADQQLNPTKRVYKRKRADISEQKEKPEPKNSQRSSTDNNLNVLLSLDLSPPVLSDDKLRKQLKNVIRKKSNDLIKKGQLDEASCVLKKLIEIEDYEKSKKTIKTTEKKNSVPTTASNNTSTGDPASSSKRLQYWYGFCSSKKSDPSMQNSTDHQSKSRFMPFRLQSDSYLGKLDVCYDRFDVLKFEQSIKSSIVSNPPPKPHATLMSDARKYKKQNFKQILKLPLYSSHFQTKLLDDKNVLRFKFFQLFDHIRPPYFGTLPKEQQTICIPKKNPFYNHSQIDYNVDSDEEWYEEEPGEDLSKSDDDEEPEQIVVEEDNLDGFLVPHGYLSQDEHSSHKSSDTKAVDDGNNQNNNSEMKRKTVSTRRPIIFGITYIEEDTCAAQNFSYFLNAEKIVGGVINYSPHVLKTLAGAVANKSKPSKCAKITAQKTNSSNTQSESFRRKCVDPLEIDGHLCRYFAKCERVKNLTIFTNHFYQHWAANFPNEPKLSKKMILDRIKLLTVKSNAVYSLKTEIA